MANFHRGTKIENIISVNEIYDIYVAQHKKGFFFPGESHDFWECSFVIEGNTHVGADENIYHLSEGDLMCFKPLGYHTFLEGEEDATVLTISFSASGYPMDFFKDKSFTLSDEQKAIANSLIELLPTEFELDLPVPEKTVYLRFFEKTPFQLQLAGTYITQLLISLFQTSTIAPASNAPDAMIFKKAVDYMNNNIGSQISIPDIANHCQVSLSGLKRYFLKFTGIGVHKYFFKLKINAAAQSLKNGSTITEAAYKFGFPSQSYFSASFKRETGITPTEYKSKFNSNKK